MLVHTSVYTAEASGDRLARVDGHDLSSSSGTSPA